MTGLAVDKTHLVLVNAVVEKEGKAIQRRGLEAITSEILKKDNRQN